MYFNYWNGLHTAFVSDSVGELINGYLLGLTRPVKNRQLLTAHLHKKVFANTIPDYGCKQAIEDGRSAAAGLEL